MKQQEHNQELNQEQDRKQVLNQKQSQEPGQTHGGLSALKPAFASRQPEAREDIIEDIERLKRERNAVILAHYYVCDEVQDIADYVGDSFGLSKKAAELDCDTLVFCGVQFMGEGAKILSPDKTVLMPEPAADCPMAHMVDPDFIRRMRAEHEDLAVVCYVNSTAETKALSDVCVTSSNALKVVGALPQKTILFVPDRHLGRFIAEQLPDKRFILNPGFCPIHDSVSAHEIKRLKAAHPDALVLAHPECPEDVMALADYAGSTSGIIDQAVNGQAQEYIIVTASGVLNQIRARTRGTGKRFYFPTPVPFCVNMGMISLEKVRAVLRAGSGPAAGEVTLPAPEICQAARASLTRMLELSK